MLGIQLLSQSFAWLAKVAIVIGLTFLIYRPTMDTTSIVHKLQQVMSTIVKIKNKIKKLFLTLLLKYRH